VLEYLEEDAAAKNFAPAQREDGTVWCPVNLPDQTESVVTLAEHADADGDTVRLGTDICGATTVAWEQAGRTRFERYFAEGGVPLYEANPPGLLADLTMSRTGAALLTTYDSAGGPSLFVLKPEELLEGPAAGTAWGSFPLVEKSDGRWFDPVQRREFVTIPALAPAADPHSITNPGSYLYYGNARASKYDDSISFSVTASTPTNDLNRLGLYTDTINEESERLSTTEAIGWPIWAVFAETGYVNGVLEALYGSTRRSLAEVATDSGPATVKEWTQPEGAKCETSVVGYYTNSWHWTAPRCDLLVGLHSVRVGYLVVHYERRNEVWIAHLTLLSWLGRELATASLEDAVPELDPSSNLRWWEYANSVTTAVHTASLEEYAPHRQRLIIAGLRADGGGLWVGRIRWWDFVPCPASSGDLAYDCWHSDDF